GWAISTPAHVQTAARSIAHKALAYGMPGVRVDGNDVLALIAVTSAAAARARAGHGPTLIEAITYRRAAHSSSDDPSVYRKSELDETTAWEQRDPLNRYGKYLQQRGLLTADIDKTYRDEIT